MPHRVIQWGTGNTGGHTLRFLLEDPAFEVVGVWVSREHNVGRTAGDRHGGSGFGGGSVLMYFYLALVVVSRAIRRNPAICRQPNAGAAALGTVDHTDSAGPGAGGLRGPSPH